MKKKDIFKFLDELEQHDETFKKWGDLYRAEEKIIGTLVQARKDKGLNQTEVAELADLKQPAVARIETGANSPQLDTLIRLTDALGLKIELKKTDRKEIDEEFYDLIFNGSNKFYYRNNDVANETYATLDNEGEITNESKSYEYTCKEYILA